MALGLPSPPPIPAGPAVPPPPNVLLFEFDIPRPGTYRVRVAVGDALIAVSNQQIQVFDDSTLLATLFTGLSAPADNYIDAQGNVLSAANWPGLNAAVTLIFQTTKVVFAIGDGVNHTYVSALQVQDSGGLQVIAVAVKRRLKPFRRRRLRHPRRVYPYFVSVAPPFSILAREPPRRLLRVKRRKLFHIRRPRLVYPVEPYVAPIVIREPKGRVRTWPRRKPLHTKKRQLLPRIIAPTPPLVLSYHPLRHPRIRRTRHFVTRRKYPILPVVRIVVENPNPTAKVVVIVN